MTDKEFLKELNKIKLKELSDEQLRKMGKDPIQVRNYEPGKTDGSAYVGCLIIGVIIIGCLGKLIFEGDSSFITGFVDIIKDIINTFKEAS